MIRRSPARAFANDARVDLAAQPRLGVALEPLLERVGQRVPALVELLQLLVDRWLFGHDYPAVEPRRLIGRDTVGKQFSAGVAQ